MKSQLLMFLGVTLSAVGFGIILGFILALGATPLWPLGFIAAGIAVAWSGAFMRVA